MIDDFPVLETPRARLMVPRFDLAAALLEYRVRNKERLRPVMPTQATDVYTLEYWAGACERAQNEALSGTALRFVVCPREPDGPPIAGWCSLTNIIRGPLQQCFLGYHLDEHYEGRGYMTEAVEAVVNYAFGELGLHRVCANYLPINERSGAMLRRLGFVVEGYARDYLFLDGAWRDHVLTARLNPAAARVQRGPEI